MNKSSCVVVGTGLAGLAAALAMATTHEAVALVGEDITPERSARDTRTTALFGASVDFLEHIGALPELRPLAQPLAGLRLIDATGGLLRAPEILFQAEEIGREAFGLNFENRDLLSALADAVRQSPRIAWHTALANRVEVEANHVSLALSNGNGVRAPLLVAADGARSRCRDAAGITSETWSYPQSALATRFAHRRPHADISSEFHFRHGPLTTVPLPGRSSSLVWVEEPEEAQRIAELSETEFRELLETRLAGILGPISDIGPRRVFPLSGLTARKFASNRIALIGEAGHQLPPIGAQGLNLGLRDAAWLAQITGDAARTGQDIGSEDIMSAFDSARRADVTTRSWAVDGLNRSLYAFGGFGDLARSVGLSAINTVPWLRTRAMQMGIGPQGALPQLLEPA
ncbi:MAG: FAD-dependent monooxygenase [Hyphomicrobiaceae bacterium]